MVEDLDLMALDNKFIYGNEFKFYPTPGTCIYNKVFHSEFLRDPVEITIQRAQSSSYLTAGYTGPNPEAWTIRCNVPELTEVSMIPLQLVKFNRIDTRANIVLGIIKFFCKEREISIRSVISNYPKFNAIVDKGVTEKGQYVSILKSYIKIINRDEKISEVIDESN